MNSVQILQIVDQCFRRNHYDVPNEDWIIFANAVEQAARATPADQKPVGRNWQERVQLRMLSTPENPNVSDLIGPSATPADQEPVNRIVARLKIEKLAQLLTETDKTKRDIIDADGETVSGVRIGWGAWALLRAKIIDVIETKCEDDARPPQKDAYHSVRDAQRLDWLMDNQCLLAHTRDLEYWGVVQVFHDDGELVTRTVARLIHDTKREAVDAAMKSAPPQKPVSDEVMP